MILSKKMMSNFIVDIENCSEAMIVETLNAIGAEVEYVFHFPKTDYLKIGKIVNIKKHPHDDSLMVCRVQIEPTQMEDIICGAKNVKTGEALNKFVIVALSGSELPNGEIISSKNIKGVISEGMLCSYGELNPDYVNYVAESERDDIIILDDARLFDQQVYKYINMDDVIFNISIPSNRPDLQGVRFLCREVAAYLKLRYIESFGYAAGSRKFMSSPIRTVNSALGYCNYFDAIYLRNKNIEKSSWNLKGVLINHLISPVNDIVDNCVLISLLTGNPITLYDADKIQGELILKRAEEYEEIIGEDDKVYTICPDDLIIRDRIKTVGIAGIVVSKVAAINDNTTAFLIEVSNYKKEKIISTADRLGVQTFQSKMFSKNISLYATQLTIGYLYEYLLKDNVPQQISSLNKVLSISKHSRKLVVNFDNIRDLIGDQNNLSDFRIKSALKSLGFEVVGNNTIYVPSYRTDISIWQDIAEEVVKIVNINTIEPQPIVADFLLNQDNSSYKMIENLNKKLRSLQISNVHTYNLTNLEDAKIFDFFNYGNPIKVMNAPTSEREYFRLNVISNLLKVLQYNKKYKNKLKPIFELQGIIASDFSVNNHVGIVIPCRLFKTAYDNNSGVVNNLLTLKGLSEVIIRNFGFNCNYEPIDSSKWLLENNALKLVVYREIIGYIGQIRPSILKKYDLDDVPVYALDINLEKLINSLNRIEHQYEPISNLQPINRDITFRLQQKDNFQTFVDVIKMIPQINRWELISYFDKNTAKAKEEKVSTNNQQPVDSASLIFKARTNHDLIPQPANNTVLTIPMPRHNPDNNNKPDIEWSSISYTVRYQIKQVDKTLSTDEINEIMNNLISSCEEAGILVQK